MDVKALVSWVSGVLSSSHVLDVHNAQFCVGSNPTILSKTDHQYRKPPCGRVSRAHMCTGAPRFVCCTRNSSGSDRDSHRSASDTAFSLSAFPHVTETHFGGVRNAKRPKALGFVR